jgi:hypothetical protein
LWPLPEETRPVEEVTLLVQLLAGRTIDESGNLAAWSPAKAAAAWQKLRNRYPDSFAATPSQVRRWRERVVEVSEKGQHWSAAVFHLEQLERDYPNDNGLRMRRALAHNHAAMEELR